MPSRGERLLAAELIGVESVLTAREISKRQVPSPRQYFAGLVTFGLLSGVALLGDTPSDFAAAFGGLLFLGALLRFPEVISWLAQQAGGSGFPLPGSPAAGGAAAGAPAIGGSVAAAVNGAGGAALTQAQDGLAGWMCDHLPGFGLLKGCKTRKETGHF